MEEKVVGRKGVSIESTTLVSIIGDGIRTKEEFGPSWCWEKTRGLQIDVTILYSNEDKKQYQGFWGWI